MHGQMGHPDPRLAVDRVQHERAAAGRIRGQQPCEPAQLIGAADESGHVIGGNPADPGNGLIIRAVIEIVRRRESQPRCRGPHFPAGFIQRLEQEQFQPLLIMDEPTAALDARAEYALFSSIRSHAEGRSMLLITHRLASVRHADRIYVLRDGRVIEQGSHDELMDLAGQYAELYLLQAAQYS